MNQRFHSLHHDNEVETVLVHVPDIFSAEAAVIENKANLMIAITFCLLQHDLQLRHICNTSRILLIKERNGVGIVIRNGIVENRLSALRFNFNKRIFLCQIVILFHHAKEPA